MKPTLLDYFTDICVCFGVTLITSVVLCALIVFLTGFLSVEENQNKAEVISLLSLFDERNELALTLKAVDMPVDFVEEITDKENAVAFCVRNPRQIKISKKEWQRMSSALKEITVFHELGHCLLNRSHNTKQISLMNEVAPHPKKYLMHREEYLRELFLNAKKESSYE